MTSCYIAEEEKTKVIVTKLQHHKGFNSITYISTLHHAVT